MSDDPWASFPDAQAIAHDEQHAGPEARSVPTQAAPPDPNDPWKDFTDSGEPPLVNSDVSIGGFKDELPTEIASNLSPQEHAEYLKLARDKNTTARQLEEWYGKHGWVLHNAADIIKKRDEGKGINTGLVRLPPEVSPHDGAFGAGLRGFGDTSTMGFLDEMGAVVDTLGGTGGRENVWNSDKKFSDLYDRNLDRNRAIIHADEAGHPVARITGQILGGLALPTGMEGVALGAGKSVLREGGSMMEARAAAAAAVRNRMAAVGGAYGGAHGAGSAEGGLGDRAVGAGAGALEGAAGGYGTAIIGQTAPRVAKALGMGSGEAPRDYAALADDLGIERTPATNSRFGVSTAIQGGLDTLPGGNHAIEAGRSTETRGLADAARATAEAAGPVTSRQAAGEAVATGAAAYRRATASAGGALYRQRDALMGGEGAPVAMDQTRETLTDMASKFPTSPAIGALREHPAIRAIEGALPENGQPLTLGEATEALSHVRGVLRGLQSDPKTPGTVVSRVAQVEQSLEDDVMEAAKQADIAAGGRAGPGSAVQAQKDADAYWAQRKTALSGALKTPLASADDDVKMSGEKVYNQLYGDMDRKGGNLKRLRDTWFRLPTNARRTFAATAIDDLGRATSGNQNDLGTNWSFNTFLSNLDKQSPQARNIIFGADADKRLSQIAAYANRLRQIDKARNFSNTAQKYFLGAYLATVGGALWKGNMQAAGETFAAMPAAWGGAKLFLATPKMRDWTAAAMKAMSTAADGNQSDTAFRVLTTRLASIAKTEPAIADDVLGLQRHLLSAVNDNAGHAAAASDGKKEKRAQ